MITYNDYTDSLRFEIVRKIQTGQITKAEACRIYCIKSHSTISNWIRKFERSDSYLQIPMKYNNSDKKELIKRIKELERQLEDEQIRSVGYSKMIDIAEEQLKVSIRKKPGTKQSKK